MERLPQHPGIRRSRAKGADGGRCYDQLYANAPTASKMISDVMIQCLAVQSCMIIAASHSWLNLNTTRLS
jgi:hypothetical protein